MTTSQFLAILYADIFDYPLKRSEVGKWAIEAQSVKLPTSPDKVGIRGASKTQNQSAKRKAFKNIEEKNGFYFLKNREKIVDLRKKKERFSEKKLKIAKKIANFLKIIPTVKMVGITGNLAMKNCDLDDDIDFLIVTSAGLMWTTRFMVTLLVEVTGKRRHPGDKKFKDKICLNFFIDENHLSIPKEERNLYTAHEVGQLMPIWNQNEICFRFLRENEWVRKYLPKAITQKGPVNPDLVGTRGKHRKKTDLPAGKAGKHRIYLCGRIFESILKKFQLWYMGKHQTTERIRDGIIKFHPEDKTEWVIKEYNRRVVKYLNCIK